MPLISRPGSYWTLTLFTYLLIDFNTLQWMGGHSAVSDCTSRVSADNFTTLLSQRYQSCSILERSFSGYRIRQETHCRIVKLVLPGKTASDRHGRLGRDVSVHSGGTDYAGTTTTIRSGAQRSSAHARRLLPAGLLATRPGRTGSLPGSTAPAVAPYPQQWLPYL